MKSYLSSEFIVERDQARCIRCKVCVNQCTYETHYYDSEEDMILSNNESCTDCQRCVVFCPTQAITIRRNPNTYRENVNWTQEAITAVKKQSETGSIILTGMGCDKPYFTYWDKILLNASQVTNPSIDPLREPMELRTYLGSKPDELDVVVEEGDIKIKTELAPQLCLSTPIMFSAISYGSTSLRIHESLARAASEFGIFFNTGEGGLDPKLYKYGSNAIMQVASGRFGVHPTYLNVGAAIEIKIGQGAKPGIGGHLPGRKVSRFGKGADSLRQATQLAGSTIKNVAKVGSGRWLDGHEMYINQFAECLINDTEPPVTVEEGFNVVKTLEDMCKLILEQEKNSSNEI